MARRAGAVLLLLLAAAATAQDARFTASLAPTRQAVRQVAVSLERALAPDAWCRASGDCGDAGECAIHSCAGGGSSGLSCSKKLLFGGSDICEDSSEPEGRIINQGRPFFRTPPGAVSSAGEGKDFEIGNRAVGRDLCALKAVGGDIVDTHKENDLKNWLYAGTANGVFTIAPGRALARKDGKFEACTTYDPRVRPWYIAASSGPKDVVFLWDSSSTKLGRALKSALNGLDVRDHVAVVSFDNSGAKTLGGGGLRAADGDAKVELVSAVDGVPPAGSNPDTTAAFTKAFQLLSGAKKAGATSSCTRFIVLLAKNDDTCFQKCSGRAAKSFCSCVSDLRAAVKKGQDALDGSKATIVSFTDGESRNANRLARTLVCDAEARGIWRQVGEDESDTSVLATVAQSTAASLYDDNPKEFASEIYTDNGGLGDVFTLAIPVYNKDKRRLLGVAATDITVKEISDTLGGDDSLARNEILKLSLDTRDCSTTVSTPDSCELQALRSQSTSAQCADILPSSSCYKFGNTIYAPGAAAASWDNAKANCASLGTGASLAVVDNAEKNRFLSGIYDSDGSWIGLRSEIGKAWAWSGGNGKALSSASEQWASFDGNTVASEVHSQSNGAACAVADRRGTVKNWDVAPCGASRNYICQMTAGSAAAAAACTGGTFEISTDYKPTNDPFCGSGEVQSCSTAQDAEMDKARPLCAEKGSGFSTFDRVCCGGEADLRKDEFSKGGLGAGAIAGIVIGSLVLLALLGFLLWWFCFRRRKAHSSTDIVVSMEPRSSIDIGDPKSGALEDPADISGRYSFESPVPDPTNLRSIEARQQAVTHEDSTTENDYGY